MCEVRFFSTAWFVDCRRSKVVQDAKTEKFNINGVGQDKSKTDEAQAISGEVSGKVIVVKFRDFFLEPSDRSLHSALALSGMFDALAVQL